MDINFNIIHRTKSIKDALHFCNVKHKLGLDSLNCLKNKMTVKINNYYFVLTEYEHLLNLKFKNTDIPDELKSYYERRNNKIVNSWKRTIFITDSNLNIINVYPGYHGNYQKISKDFNISIGTIKSYVYHSLFYFSKQSSRKFLFFNRSSYFEALNFKNQL